MGFRQHDKRRCQTEKERIAVRLRCRGSLCGNDAAAAWTVDDQDLLCPHLREAVGDDPRNHIRSAGSGTTASPLKADMPDSPRDVAEGPTADSCSAANRLAYSITSSARASSVGGTSMPSVLAVCRLIRNSNRVARMIGKSAGFSPLRTRPT